MKQLRATKDVDAPTGKQDKPSARQLNAAVAVIEELSTDWDPKRHKDEYRKRLQTVVAQKRKGKTVDVAEPEESHEPVPDLMEALERTLAELK